MSLDMTMGTREAALDATVEQIEAEAAPVARLWLQDLLVVTGDRLWRVAVARRSACCCSCADHSSNSARRESDANCRRHSTTATATLVTINSHGLMNQPR